MKPFHFSGHKSTVLPSATLILGSLFSINAEAIVPPTGYDVWSADAYSNISATCPANYRCAAEVNERGFLQERLDELNLNGTIKRGGSVFYRTIISEKDYSNATLASSLQLNWLKSSRLPESQSAVACR